MTIDIAILIYLLLLGVIGYWKGLIRQLAQVLSFFWALAMVFVFREGFLDLMASKFDVQGLASRLALLPVFFIVWILSFFILSRLVKPLETKPARALGASFGLIWGLLVVLVLMSICDLAVPTMELRFPAMAKILKGSFFFNCAQLINQSKYNPLAKVAAIGRVRDVFLAPVDYAAWKRIEDDPNYQALQEKDSLVDLNWDEDFGKAVQEGHYWVAIENPTFITLLNDEGAYRAFIVFIQGKKETAVPIDYITPMPTPPADEVPPDLTPAPVEATPSPSPIPMKLIILKNGNRLEGIIRSQTSDRVTADIVMGDDLIRIIFRPREIAEIRDAD